MAPTPANSRVGKPATCEDYDSDVDETVPDSQTQANQSTKRASPLLSPDGTPGINNSSHKVKIVQPGDIHSDSGYSSHTQATGGSSADAGKSEPSNSGGASLKVDTEVKGRSRSSTNQKNSVASSSPVKKSTAPSRTASTKKRKDSATDKCDVPNCTCKASQRGRKTSIKTSSNSSQASSRNPPPTTERRPSRPAPAIIQPATTQRRPRASSRTRPMSYHAGMTEAGYPYYPPAPAQPRAMPNAYYNSQPMQAQSYSYGTTPPMAGGYFPNTSPSAVRPPVVRGNTGLSARTPAPPMVHYGDGHGYDAPPQRQEPVANTKSTLQRPTVSARHPVAPVLPRAPSPVPAYRELESDSEEDSNVSDESDASEEYETPRKRKAARDKARMPPPATKPTKPIPPNRRLSMRNASVPEAYGSPNVMYDDRDPLADSLNSLELYRPTSRSTTNPSSRGSSNRRPPLTSKATSFSNSTNSARVIPGDRRREMSYYGTEQRAEIAQRQRELEALQYQEDRTAQAQQFNDFHQRGSTFDNVARMQQLREDRDRLEAQLRRQGRGSENTIPQPLTENALRRVKVPSDESSHRSRNSISSRGDATTRINGERPQRPAVTAGPASERGDTVSAAELQGVKLRVDIRSGFEIEHENHTITLVPGEGDGKAQLIIGSRTGRETSYAGSTAAPSAKGSVVSRVTRRDVEEEKKRKAVEREWQREREREEQERKEREAEHEEEIKRHERELKELRRARNSVSRDEDSRSKKSKSSLKSLRSFGKRRVEETGTYGA